MKLMQRSKTCFNNIEIDLIILRTFIKFKEKNSSFISLTVKLCSGWFAVKIFKHLSKVTDKGSISFARLGPISMKKLLNDFAMVFESVISLFPIQFFKEVLLYFFFPKSFFNHGPVFFKLSLYHFRKVKFFERFFIVSNCRL